jgi:hypothetical protein
MSTTWKHTSWIQDIDHALTEFRKLPTDEQNSLIASYRGISVETLTKMLWSAERQLRGFGDRRFGRWLQQHMKSEQP